MRAEIRTPEGLLAADLVEAAHLDALDEPGPASHEGSLDASGRFVFRRLPPGNYRLTVLTAAEEVVIRRIVVGDVAPDAP